MKSLKIILTLEKIGKIFSKIIFIFCIIGAIGCLTGIVTLAIGGRTIVIGGKDLFSYIMEWGDLTDGDLYTAMSVGLVSCVFEAVLSKFANQYFKTELELGDPFTEKSVKETRVLGILTIVLPIASAMISGIVYSVLKMTMEFSDELKLDNGGSVALGIMFLILSVVYQYGTDRLAGKKEETHE